MLKPVVASVPVIIVAFGKPLEVDRCLRALSRLEPDPSHEIFICENAGHSAFDELLATLTGPQGSCTPSDGPVIGSAALERVCRLQLRTTDPSRPVNVHVGQAIENLGYAGGVNAWLRPLLDLMGWSGIWILNPDTEPEPPALSELSRYAEANHRNMVGSRITPRKRLDVVHNRGLAWRKWRASTLSVDLYAPAAYSPPPDDVDPRLDAPSGASLYVTRQCIEWIGLMDERYFLYFEDLDWGLRAKKYGLGYAHKSVVIHEGGTSIGTSISRRDQSPLAIYLDFRNRILFVRTHFPIWLPWTLIVEVMEMFLYARVWTFAKMVIGSRGIIAGVMGRTGCPSDIIRAHRAAMERS
jgi:N-acetylglucosaminyl-diphospho-decaprenol L-rhamnosyltransferase